MIQEIDYSDPRYSVRETGARVPSFFKATILGSPTACKNYLPMDVLSLGCLDSSTGQTSPPCSRTSFSCLVYCSLPNFCNRDTDNAARSALCYSYLMQSHIRFVAQDRCSSQNSVSHHLPSCPRNYTTSSKADLTPAFL